MFASGRIVSGGGKRGSIRGGGSATSLSALVASLLIAAGCSGDGTGGIITGGVESTTSTATTAAVDTTPATTEETTTSTEAATTSTAATTTVPGQPDDPTPGVLTVHDLAGRPVEDPFFDSGFHQMDRAGEDSLVSQDSLTGGAGDFLALAHLDPPPTITGLGDGQILLRAWVEAASDTPAPDAAVFYTETADGWAATIVIDTPSLDDALSGTTDYRAVRPGGVDAIEVVVETFAVGAGVTFTALVEAFLAGARFYEGEVECAIDGPMECTTLSDDGILRIEDEGEDVEALQEDLIAAGYLSGPVDGVYGSGTEAAVVRFQTDYRLGVDGSAGPETLDVLSRVLDGTYPYLVASDARVGYVSFGVPWQDAYNTLTAGLGAPSGDTGWYVDACDGNDWRQVSWGGFNAIFTDRSGSRIFDGWRALDLAAVPSTVLFAHGLTTSWRWSDLAANGAVWEPFYGGVWSIPAWGYNGGRLAGAQPDPPDPNAQIEGFGTGTGGFASC